METITKICCVKSGVNEWTPQNLFNSTFSRACGPLPSPFNNYYYTNSNTSFIVLCYVYREELKLTYFYWYIIIIVWLTIEWD